MKAAVVLSVILPLSAFGGTTTVAPGANLTLIASAEGTPAPTFQWRKNGNSISGATNSTLAILAVTTADAGAYQVVATNTAGSVASPDELIVVGSSGTSMAPSFIAQPVATQTVSVGGSAQFSVVVAGIPTPSVQWKKDGVAIAGATNLTFTLSSVVAGDAGTYVAEATNSVGTATSAPALLTVSGSTPTQVAPQITTQPVSQTLVAGSSASFSVGVSGTPTPTVQWRKDGVDLSGATNTTLTLASVTLSNAGSYTVHATSSAGVATSLPAVLTVTEPVVGGTIPKIISQPTSQTVAAGANVTFSAAASGSPAPTYQWRKNGANIAGATNASLSLTSVSSSDAASYNVIASNSAGSAASESAMLYVQSAPVFTAQPVAQAVTAGGTARFSAAVSALPGASFQWKKNDTSIPGATASTLQISLVSSSDVAMYKLVATNTLGSTMSDEVPLVIAATPTISSQPADQSVAAKSNVTFAVTASGSPAPTYQWKKNGTSITGATKDTFILKNVNKSDAGEYSVEVRNSVGWTVSNRAKLTISNGAGGRTSSEEGDPVIAGPSGASPIGLVNLSVRANAGTGSNGLIVGFVIDGAPAKPVLVRGVGPSLRAFGVSGALVDPQLALFAGATVTAANDDWSTNENVAQIVGASNRVGAFSLVDQGSDSALMATLSQGAYTVQLTGKDATNGVALVEVYDAASNSDAELVNLSVRTQIGSGTDAPNVGFVIAGQTPRRLLIRAVGPTLGSFGVAGAISDPQVELFRGNVRIDHNDNWGGAVDFGETFSRVGAFGFADASSKDAVIVTTLEPGAYTVVVSGVNGSKGIGLVEVYNAP